MKTLVQPPVPVPVTYPSLSDRIQSTFIDTIVIIAAMAVASSWLDGNEEAPDWIRAALFFGIWGVYEPVATSLGGTVGNLVKGIRVRAVSNPARRIHLLQALLRYAFKVGLGWVSFLTMHSNHQRRAIHDLVAGSVMIRKGE